jgi:hypothetical protein
VTGPVPKRKREPLYKAGIIKADDGTEIYTLKIVGWK